MTVVTFLILWFPWFPPYTTYTQVQGRIHEYFLGGGQTQSTLPPPPDRSSSSFIRFQILLLFNALISF